MAQRRDYRRPAKAQPKKKGVVKSKSDYAEPRIDPGLKSVFRKIGVPEPGPFEPDPFQREALNLIKDYDVLVSAPTGSGKTWIASQTIDFCLTKGMRVWYASPLKALSNSIYQEFCQEFGSQYCGILTGDRKENPERRSLSARPRFLGTSFTMPCIMESASVRISWSWMKPII